jgi:hypothetical protein
MVSTPVFGTESDDSAVNTEEIEPVVLLRRARVFDGVLGRFMRIEKAGRKSSMTTKEPSRGVYIGVDYTKLYGATSSSDTQNTPTKHSSCITSRTTFGKITTSASISKVTGDTS